VADWVLARLQDMPAAGIPATGKCGGCGEALAARTG